MTGEALYEYCSSFERSQSESIQRTNSNSMIRTARWHTSCLYCLCTNHQPSHWKPSFKPSNCRVTRQTPAYPQRQIMYLTTLWLLWHLKSKNNPEFGHPLYHSAYYVHTDIIFAGPDIVCTSTNVGPRLDRPISDPCKSVCTPLKSSPGIGRQHIDTPTSTQKTLMLKPTSPTLVWFFCASNKHLHLYSNKHTQKGCRLVAMSSECPI